MWDSDFGALRRRAGRPFVGSPASDRGHVVARFVRQRAVAGKPRAYSSRTGIVGCRGESEVAKPVPQFAEIARRVTQRLNRTPYRVKLRSPKVAQRPDINALIPGAVQTLRRQSSWLPFSAEIVPPANRLGTVILGLTALFHGARAC